MRLFCSILASFFVSVAAFGQGRIVATPAVAMPIVPANEPVKLDVGKFVWLHVPDYKGFVTWDISSVGVVEISPEGEGPWFGGWRQGTPKPSWHRVPDGSVPLFGDAKIDAGKFDFMSIPKIDQRYGGVRQGESKAAWHKLVDDRAVPVLGVSKGAVTVTAWVLVGDKIESARPRKFAEIVLAVDGATPDDGKKEMPRPATKDIQIVIVRSAVSLTPSQANLIGDVAFWDSLKTGNSDWLACNPTDKVAIEKGYADLASKKQQVGEYKPVLIVLDKSDGTPLYCELMPANKAAVKAAVEGVRK